ncbi:MAG: hypothetical protein IKS49_00250 [Actinomycetaceae bacterium]|nr:hypothetical protein [Actinomycetaceae bacterium]
MAKKHKRKKTQKKHGERTESVELTEYAEHDKSVERDEPTGLERREDLERELTYAKSEIGTVAGRLLKYTPFPRRVAIISAVVVLALGVGVTVGVHQIRSVFGSGDGVIETVTDDDSQSQDLSAENDEEAKTEQDAKTEADTDANSSSRSAATASFTKGEDGIYRWHGDAGPARYNEDWNDEYTFEIPVEIRTSAQPYVLHIHTGLRNDVEVRGKKFANVSVYSSPKGRIALSGQDLYSVPNEDWGSAESADLYAPFFPNNPRVDNELAWIKLQARGVDVDMEFLTVSQAPLRTWDGHSKLEQKESELFRVTGPITATHLSVASKDNVSVYGYRHGDSSFTPLATVFSAINDTDTDDKYERAELTGNEFATEPYTLDGVELLWVETPFFLLLNEGTWSLE